MDQIFKIGGAAAAHPPSSSRIKDLVERQSRIISTIMMSGVSQV